MESLEIKTITLNLDDYREMLEKVCEHQCIKKDLEYLIDEARLNYDKSKLVIDENVEMFAKKYCPNEYFSRLKSLQLRRRNERRRKIKWNKVFY